MLHMPFHFCFLLHDEQMWAFGFSKPQLWDTSARDSAQINVLQYPGCHIDFQKMEKNGEIEQLSLI